MAELTGEEIINCDQFWDSEEVEIIAEEEVTIPPGYIPKKEGDTDFVEGNFWIAKNGHWIIA